jgi:hypothetical protein
MPAPTSAQLKPLANGFLKAAGLLGEDIPGLAQALADGVAQALNSLLSQAQVMPGIPAAVDPISSSGSTAGPGFLMPPPAGGPGPSQIEGPTQNFLKGQGIRGKDAPGLGKAVAATVGQAILLFTGQSMVMPGMAVAGFTSTSPGKLIPMPLQAQIQPLAMGFLQQNSLKGQDSPALGGALAQLVDMALVLFTAQSMVSPGIACPPGASASPGRLM